MSRGAVVLVDDEENVRESAREWLVLSGFDVFTAPNAEAALAGLDPRDCDALITDVRMPGMGGLALLAEARRRDPALPVILLTGHGDVPLAVEAMRGGAHDFLEKPYDADHLVAVLDRAVSQRRLNREVERLRDAVDASASIETRFIGDSSPARALRAQVAQLASLDVDVLIHGETGTGKEVVARALHDFGKRRDRTFVALNCAAIPESVFESEVFGHDRGAFTGAAQKRVGRIEHANGGTVFLDEVESMPLALQAKLLRVIQEREVEPLGANRRVSVDVRFVAATKADLRAESDAGRFRADLYFRLATVVVTIPPLRQRRQDVALLFRHFCIEAANRHSVDPREPDAGLLTALEDADWPGNVRELRAAAERFALGLPLDPASSIAGQPNQPSLAERVATFEARLIAQVLAETGGNTQEASRLLGVPLRTLNEKIQRHGLRQSRS
ncbi:MAG: sigma-54 dependent transcriptional regulator [Aquamicrobium sp.]|nr:sigma-54 dependent transcriptional regulator [Aquamicrobium sp.]